MIANRSTLTFMSAVVAAAGALGWASSPARAVTNMLANPGFENGSGGASLAGWTTFGNAFTADATTGLVPHGGGGMLKMFGTFSGVSGAFQMFATTPGTTYLMDAWANQIPGDALTGGPNFILERIAFFDSANNEITAAGVQSTIVNGTYTPNNWTDGATITATAPAGAVKVQPFLLFIQPAFDGGSGVVDDVTFGVVPEPTSLSLLGLGAAALLGRRRR